jgi:hypothetical protein
MTDDIKQVGLTNEQYEIVSNVLAEHLHRAWDQFADLIENDNRFKNLRPTQPKLGDVEEFSSQWYDLTDGYADTLTELIDNMETWTFAQWVFAPDNEWVRP